jgi:hypothetical protein
VPRLIGGPNAAADGSQSRVNRNRRFADAMKRQRLDAPLSDGKLVFRGIQLFRDIQYVNLD